MENKKAIIEDVTTLEAPVRAQLLKSLSPFEKRKAVTNLVECAMRVGIMDAFEIRLWLGLTNYSIKSITQSRNDIRKRWFAESENIAEAAATERVVQIKKVWEEIRKCETLYDEAKSVGDKIKVKQLQLEYMKYVAKLNFVDSIVEAEGPNTQINIVGHSLHESN